MLHFLNDYEELGHPKVLDKLSANWGKYFPGYGYDEVSTKVREKIKKFTKCQNAESYLIAGGTLTNLLACSAFLYSYESIIAADTAHIENLEAGAIEASGHKILTYPNVDGKLNAEIIEQAVRENTSETKTRPGLVFLANASETGTIYSKQELSELSVVCRKHDLILFLDGARLGFALASEKSDLTLETIAELTDVFYIGGTKNGAIYGEALVITNPYLQRNFIHAIKNRGALLAKGYATALQFEALFETADGKDTEVFAESLYYTAAKHANKIAERLSELFVEKGFALASSTDANQVFVYLPNELIVSLKNNVTFEVHSKGSTESKCRFVCTFANTVEDVDNLRDLLN